MSTQAKPSTTSLTFMGVLMIVLGILAIGSPAVAGEMVVQIIGAVLLIVGVLQVVTGLRADELSHKLPPIILGVLLGLCGIGLLGRPWFGMTYIALMMAIFFIIEGVWKMIASFSYRPASGWVFMLLSGLIALVLGIMIWRQWPLSGMWAVGILVGVDLMTTGISMVTLASAMRRMAKLPAG